MVYAEKCLYIILDKLGYTTDQCSWQQEKSVVWWKLTMSNFKQVDPLFGTEKLRHKRTDGHDHHKNTLLFFTLNRQPNNSFCPGCFQFFNLYYNYIPVSAAIQHIFAENPEP
jgi:hypothetical protein